MTIILSFHPCGMIVSHMWNDRLTLVERSSHPGETVYLKRHFNKIFTASGNKICLFYVCLASFYFLFAGKDLVDTGILAEKIWWILAKYRKRFGGNFEKKESIGICLALSRKNVSLLAIENLKF